MLVKSVHSLLGKTRKCVILITKSEHSPCIYDIAIQRKGAASSFDYNLSHMFFKTFYVF